MLADYPKAALRHWADATHLAALPAPRIDTADHLLGIAVECALKALLIAAGAPSDAGGVRDPSHRVHLPDLWTEYLAFASGRSGAYHARIQALGTPFSTWSIDARYVGDGHVQASEHTDHRAAAFQVLLALQLAQADGRIS